MSKPFDVTTKQLVETNPAAWVRYAGLPADKAELIDSDLATITTEADRVIRVNSALPYLTHIEFQSTYKPDLADRTLRYNVLLYYRHGLPVQSVIVLLRPEADGSAMNGVVEYVTNSTDGSLSFRYRVLRVWEQSADALLAGDLATLPLALLTDVSPDQLPELVRRMESRLQAEATRTEAELLWTATYVLLGLRYPAAFAGELLKGVRAMEDSITYQAIIAKGEARGRMEGQTAGRAEEARSLILRLGRKRFGEPNGDTLAVLQNINELDELERLAERLLEVENWAELLA